MLDENLVMASDSRMSGGGHHFGDNAEKIFQVGGYTIGVAGRYAECLAFVSMFEDVVERESLRQITSIPIPENIVEDMDNFNAIVVSPYGEVFFYESSRFSTPSDTPVCIGSGSEYAYGALAMGADAVKAIECAMKYDLFTGGEIKSVQCQKEDPPIQDIDLVAAKKMSKKELLKFLFGEEAEE